MTDPRDLDAATVLALTIWGEARGEKRLGKEAVASVIMNRVALRAAGVGPKAWGTTVADVCLAHLQFSSWNANDPNRAKMFALADSQLVDKAYVECQVVAREAMRGNLEDNTNEADHYLVTSIANKTKWAKGKTPVAVIGAHSFYKFYSLPKSVSVQPPAPEAVGAARQDTVASPAVAQPRPSPPPTPLLPSTTSASLPEAAATVAPPPVFSQPDVEPPPPAEPEPWWRIILGSKRLKAGVTLAGGSQVPGMVDSAWETFTDWFKDDPDAVETLWSHAVTLLAIKWVGYALFAAGAAWLLVTLFIDRRQKR